MSKSKFTKVSFKSGESIILEVNYLVLREHMNTTFQGVGKVHWFMCDEFSLNLSEVEYVIPAREKRITDY